MQETGQAFRNRSKLLAWLGSACLLAGVNPAPAHAYISSAAYGAVFGCASQVAPVLPIANAQALAARLKARGADIVAGGGNAAPPSGWSMI